VGEAASGGRIAANIMDTPTTVTVLTSDFLNDVGGTRVLDATKYVAGVSESNIPNALDRITIRGFQTDGRRVDGFSTADQANYDHGAIERIEVVKGPDALLHPSGAPGGTINLVTKRPQFTKGASLKVQVGQYDTNRIEADSTGPLGDNFAYRMIVAVQDNDGYVQNSTRQSELISPSLTWRMSPQSNLTLRYEYYHFMASNFEGVPTDPSVGTNGSFKTLQGVPFNFSAAFPLDKEFRKVESHSATVLYTSTITDRLSVRLAGRISEANTPDSDMRWGFDQPGGSRNPFTGEWEPGILWVQTSVDPAPKTFAPTPAPMPSSIIAHTGTQQGQKLRYRDVQNDWVYAFSTDHIDSTTMVGFAYALENQNVTAARRVASSFDYLNFTGPGPDPIVEPLNTDRKRNVTRYQTYLTQSLEFFQKRLILSGGLSHIAFNGFGGNKLAVATPPPNPTVAGQLFPASGSKTTTNYGIVIKPLNNVSIYYGHTENAVPPNDFQQAARGDAPLFSEGSQDEVGIKLRFFDGRLIASVAYYEVEQTGYAVNNPGNLASPQPPVQLPPLILSREGSGWEFQVAGSVTESLSIMASYADTKNRDPNGVMLRGSAEDMGSVFVRYEFTRGQFSGLALALGANYMSKRSVENVSGFTPASTPTDLIPNQPSAYLPARTLIDATLSYTRGTWSYGLTVSNALDKRHYASALSRTLVNVGTPRNVSGSVTYRF